MLYICNTFDYELFMGKNYNSEHKVLISPTEKLARMLVEEKVPSTFFADVCSAVRYRELGKKEFPEQFDGQLKDMIQMGHDVQLHVHSNWIKATEVGANVVFDRDTFRLHNFAENGDYAPVKEIIHNGVKYLTDLLIPANKEYKCIAYRAGGYCIQPEAELAEILYDEGIRIDSSICCGHAHNGDGMQYDFLAYRKPFNLYFNRNVQLKEGCQTSIEGGLFEIPVGGYSTFPYRVIASKKNQRISNAKATGYGMSLEHRKPIKNTLSSRIKHTLTATNMLTFDFFHSNAMIYMLNRICKEQKCDRNNLFVAIISHPKLFSDDHIENMRRGVRELKKNPNIRFISMSDAKILERVVEE